MEARYRASSALAPTAPTTTPVAVVSTQFCAAHTVPLTVTKKAMSFSGGDFTVTDASGAAVLQVEGIRFSVGSRRVVRDAAAGRPILTLQAKVFSMHNEWKVFRGDSTSSSDLLFTVKRNSIFQLKTNMEVFLARNTTKHVCDFKIKGSYFERSCAFYRGNSSTMIAQMKRKFTTSNVLLGKDTFSVSVFPHVDYVFIVALVLILDEIHRSK